MIIIMMKSILNAVSSVVPRGPYLVPHRQGHVNDTVLMAVLSFRGISTGWKNGHNSYLMNFKKGKSQALHLARNNPTYQNRLETTSREVALQRKP